MASTPRDDEVPRLMQIIRADNIPWYKKPNLRCLYLIIIPVCVANEWTQGFEGSMMNNLQNVPAWLEYFNYPSGVQLGLLSAIQNVGTIMAVPFAPYLTNLVGRKYSILIGNLINLIGACLQSAAQNTNMFLGARWLIGFGMVFCVINACALMGEVSYARERPILTSIFNPNWFIGTLLASAVTYNTFNMTSEWSWRIPSIVQIGFTFVPLTFLYFIPESPRWLMAKNRNEEALAILTKYHSEGVDGDEFVRLEYAEIQSSLTIEKDMAKSFLWADVLRDKPMRRRFLVAGLGALFSQTSGNNILNYYMSIVLRMVGITNTRTIQQILISYNCWGFANALPIALIVPRYPRRRIFLIGTWGLLITFTVWTITAARYAISGSTAAAYTNIVFIFLFNPFTNFGFNALGDTYTIELFPYTQRTQAMAFKQAIGRMGAFFNTFTNPIALEALQWRYYIIYCVWLAVDCAVVYFLYPETYGKTLEELSFFLEGEEVQERAAAQLQKVLDNDEACNTKVMHKATREGETA